MIQIDLEKIIFGSNDGQIRIWDTKKEIQLKISEKNDNAINKIVFTHSIKSLVSVDYFNNLITIWDSCELNILKIIKTNNKISDIMYNKQLGILT